MPTPWKRMFFPAMILLGLGQAVFSQPLDSILAAANSDGKAVLLVFSGSDWCLPCRRLEKEVFQDSLFRAFAARELLILKADFPQRTKQSKALQARNERLADQYNPNGHFPHLLLLDEKGEVLSLIAHQGAGADQIQAQIEGQLPKPQLEEHRRKVNLMGSTFEFVVVSDRDEGDRLLDLAEAEVVRLERIISSWDPDSQTSAINRAAGAEAVEVEPELYQLIERSVALSELTQGAFDITFASVGGLWHFDGSSQTWPDSLALAASTLHIGYDKIRLPGSNRVQLAEAGMKIGFGAIGKGFAAEKVKALLVREGVTGGVVNAGGDLCAWGLRASGEPWSVAIADPRSRGEIMAWLKVSDQAVATSGDYERYLLIDGKRYGHIIDPRTGIPAKGVISATVISPDAELSDALASAVFVLGVEVGIDLIDQLPDSECLLVDDEGQIHRSIHLELHANEQKTP